ncbi:hypothetical protein ACFW1M_22485 [Streptomyces inhibens]|uniref:hypothetical protein n=1 Tax=Streptomyces inhibens TaxID=2293571 RepID=UPI0036CA10E7
MRRSVSGDPGLTVGEADVMTAFFWVLMLALWPITAGLLIGSRVIAKRGGKPRTFHMKSST